jgi:tRNA(fMet)-specific endonuclease VapC
MYTLDTDTIIYHLTKQISLPDIDADIFAPQTPLFISTVTELELFSSPTLTVQEAAQIESILPTLSIIQLDSTLARIAAFLRREYCLKTPDSVIAATAIFTRSTLLTNNIKDFKKVHGLKVQKV